MNKKSNVKNVFPPKFHENSCKFRGKVGRKEGRKPGGEEEVIGEKKNQKK